MSFWAPERSREQERLLRPLKVPRTRALLQRLGSPQSRYPCVLVAGTKGKGSTAAFIADGLRAAGYRVGRYTQPHLIDWRERTWVDGDLIQPAEVADLAGRIRPEVEALGREPEGLGGLTTYEVGTALTLAYFAERQVDVAVLEIGVGGRLDALNAVDPVLSVVTSISFDHADVLGNTLAEIAAEKAGIFRPGRAAVSAPQPLEVEMVLRRVALEQGTRLYLVGREGTRPPVPDPSLPPGEWSREEGCRADRPAAPSAGYEGPGGGAWSPAPHGSRRGDGGGREARGCDWWWREGAEPDLVDVHGPYGALEGLRVTLLGDHQRDNAAVAVACLQLLGEVGFVVAAGAVRKALSEVEWPGRVQRLRSDPTVVVDAAHNADSARCLVETIRKQFRYRRLILVFGASGDKDVEGMARELGPVADQVVVTSSGHRRAADVEVLARHFSGYSRVRAVPDPSAALAEAVAMASPPDLVLVTGSVFLVGRALQVMSDG